MKMHQFAFVQKCPALKSTALPPPPLNVRLTLSGGKVNMSTAPYCLLLLYVNTVNKNNDHSKKCNKNDFKISKRKRF